ncbi:alpha/beta hydrolase [Ferrimicrobium sp.]|uniref:alpha/beta hydrolase family protein n=1 Tax=Ferrimicrobium sp. TaxID=2926050 RepID=UPI0026210BC0|nr:alpha/beta hydrolase [Ferrimicrobium sp.]
MQVSRPARSTLLVGIIGAVVVLIAALFVANRPATTPARLSVPTATTAPGDSSAANSTPPVTSQSTGSPIRGVGEYSTTVIEDGRILCVPSTGACSTRSYLLHVYYPSTKVTPAHPVVDASPATSGSPYPLIVFAAGFDVDPSNYLPLISGWVRNGYVVAAPRFPLSSAWAIAHYGVNLSDTELADAFESDMLNQPGDMRAAIAEVSLLSQNPSTPLTTLVNTNEVAAAGQSDGGDTTLAFTDNTCCRDTAVKAAIILSGAEFSPYGGEYFPSPPMPLMVAQGTADTVNPPGLSTQIYDQAPAPKVYLQLLGADHLEAYTQYNAYENAVLKTSLAFLATYLRGAPVAVTHLTTIGNIPNVGSEQADLS